MEKTEGNSINETMDKILILDNIRSVFNVGSIFRTADAIGVNKIYLIGTTPTPLDRFGRIRKDVAKVALGSEKTLEWEYVKQEEVENLIQKLKKENHKIISLEQSDISVDYKEIKNQIKSADQPGELKGIVVVLGNEVDGVCEEILKNSDLIAEIPMRGLKESLNVSVSAGIFLFSIFDK